MPRTSAGTTIMKRCSSIGIPNRSYPVRIVISKTPISSVYQSQRYAIGYRAAIVRAD
jgi:hypothetical protein